MSRHNVRIVPWNEYQDVLKSIRDRVFIEEQGVPESLERDPNDAGYVHALATTDTGEPIGTGRLLPDGWIGRMAVLPAWRSRRIGTSILFSLISAAKERGDREIRLNAQLSAVRFYHLHGFLPEGSQFIEAGIPHIRMRLPLE